MTDLRWIDDDGAALFDPRTWARWVPTFLGFPLAGLAARAVAGNIDDVPAAVVGGLAAGAVLGAVQAFGVSRTLTNRLGWAAATAAGLSVGLAAGAWLVDFSTDTGSLVAMGALSGAGVGIAQGLVMRTRSLRRAAWALSSSALWALGWWVTSMVIVDVDRQHANFGASGALLATLLGGLVLAFRPDAAPIDGGAVVSPPRMAVR